jgi:hypothetical protein
MTSSERKQQVEKLINQTELTEEERIAAEAWGIREFKIRKIQKAKHGDYWTDKENEKPK